MKRFRVEAPAAIYFDVQASTEEEAKERAADMIDEHADLEGYALKLNRKIETRVFFNEDITTEHLEIVDEQTDDDATEEDEENDADATEEDEENDAEDD